MLNVIIHIAIDICYEHIWSDEKMAKRKNVDALTWQYDDYYPYRLEQLDERALRKEYSRLREIANRRLKRLLASEYKETDIAKEYAGGFAILAAVEDLPRELTKLARFVASERTSVTGLHRIEKQTISTLHKHGYTFVNSGNIHQFGNFMEEMRQAGYGKLYSSEFLANWWSEQSKSKRDNADKLKREFDNYVSQNMDN